MFLLIKMLFFVTDLYVMVYHNTCIQVSDKKTTFLSTMSSPDYNYSIFKHMFVLFFSFFPGKDC